MTVREHTTVNVVLLLVVAMFGALGATLSRTAGTVPLVVACITAAFAGAQLVADRMKPPATAEAAPERSIMLTLLALLAALYFAGFALALPAFAGLYWRWRAGASWKACLAVTAVLIAAVYGGLTLLLRMDIYPGAFAEWLSR